jgi:hypothetical protein
LAASATALNDIGTNQINKKFNSNENLLDESQRQDIEDVMLIEKAKSDSYMKYLELQQQQLLIGVLKSYFSNLLFLDKA